MRRLLAPLVVAAAACTAPSLGLICVTDPSGRDGAFDAPPGNSVVNVCRPVVFASNGTVALASADGIAAGSPLLVMQVQDDFAASGDPEGIASARDAGRWEVVRASSVTAASIRVTPRLVHRYRSSGTRRAQACTVFEPTDVTLAPGAVLAASAWTGSSGGVVAVFATGRVLLEGTITAEGAGFRGGSPSATAPSTASGFGDASLLAADSDDPRQAGEKGEGLDGRAAGRYGRGRLATAGGGGNAYNAGGGGGAGGGAGGSGGKQHNGSGDVAQTAGEGGAAELLPMPERALLGGGGGGGHGNDGIAAAGAAGGGLVFIRARELEGAGAILAGGAAGAAAGLPAATSGDGGGGGGGGGTVLLTVDDATGFSGVLRARGGAGSDVFDDDDLYGPGGGGGGGRIRAPGVAPAVIDVQGGAAGTNANQAADPWGASAGEDGVVAVTF